MGVGGCLGRREIWKRRERRKQGLEASRPARRAPASDLPVSLGTTVEWLGAVRPLLVGGSEPGRQAGPTLATGTRDGRAVHGGLEESPGALWSLTRGDIGQQLGRYLGTWLFQLSWEVVCPPPLGLVLET